MGSSLPRRVVIVLHERDGRAERRPYVVWGLADSWRRMGIEVVVSRGARFVDADVAFNHVDATKTPPAYARLFERYPLAIDGRCLDVSKRRVSANLLGRGDLWTGPVVVKTDANCGGKADARLRTGFERVREGARAASVALRWGAARERARWARTPRIRTDDYPVFESLRAVPDGVFENPALVVERFLPERRGDHYVLDLYYVLGDRRFAERAFAPHPIVKAARVVGSEPVEPHPDVVAAADGLGLDFGKVDYVVSGGTAHVLDVNRTPTFGPKADEALVRRTSDELAAGLASLWANRGGRAGSSPR